MDIDRIPRDREEMAAPERRPKGLAVIVVVLVLMAAGELYMMGRLSSLRASLAAEQTRARAELNAKMGELMAADERANAQVLQSLKDDLSASTRMVGNTEGELRRERALVAKLSKLQKHQAEELQKQVEQKADAQQVGTLTQDVSATKDDLNTAKKNLDNLSKDLGMARSELGTLIATNHTEIQELRRRGERDYFEFTLTKNQRSNIAGVGLILKKTNPKRNQFGLVMLADDQKLEKKNRSINEPVLFSVSGSKQFYELVVNEVKSDSVKGYISRPKGTEMAER